MASSTNTTSQASTKYDKYLDERIAQTAMQVKWTELLSFFLTVAIFVLGMLFVFCLVDAWIVELQVWMRWSALFVLIGFSSAYTIFKALPFFLHRVNPLYAAKKLEEGRPDLKNSVINYLTTDTNSQKKSARVIRQRMSKKAANDVANIPIDVSVDRSQMIVAGYVLSAIVALFALYKMLSPKDPFQTIGRVILPASDLLSPARVKISDLTPGDEKKYFGETVEISAKIKGLRQNEFARVLVATDDGRKKDVEIPLHFNEQSKTFRAIIGDQGGLKESFTYRIEAGDAKSLDYRIDVRTCPTIFVETIEYLPPAYTGIPDQIVENPDSISAVEGTLCRINARANLPIQSANIELFREIRVPPSKNTDSNQEVQTRIEKYKAIKLDVSDENLAVGSFTLELNSKRDAQRFSHYQVVFTSNEGDKSENPNRAEIDVIADLKPEVEIIAPQDKVVEVPENQSEKISISAVDPDYGLTAIVLVAENRGNRLFEKLLFKSEGPEGARGKQVVTFSFQPDQFGLQPGDEVIWYARAEDNRAVGKKQTLFPNRQRTTNYRFVITPPLQKGTGEKPDKQDSVQPGENKDQKNKDQKNKDQRSGEPKEEPQPENSGQEKGGQSKQSDPSKQGGNSKQEKKGSSSSRGGSGSQKNKSDPMENRPEGKDPQDSQGKQQSPGDRQGNNSNNKQRGNGDSKQANTGQQNGDDARRGASKSGSDNRQSNGQKSNSKPENGKPEGNQSTGEGPSQGDRNPTNDSQDSPGSPSAENRGKPGNSKEAFERLKDYFENGNQGPEKQEGESPASDDPANQNTDGLKEGAQQKASNPKPGKANGEGKQSGSEKESQGPGEEKKSAKGDASSKDPGKSGQTAGEENAADPGRNPGGNDPEKSSGKKSGSKQAQSEQANGTQKSDGSPKRPGGKKGQGAKKTETVRSGEPGGKSQDQASKKNGGKKNGGEDRSNTDGGKNPQGKTSNASDQPGKNSGGRSGDVNSTSSDREKRGQDSNPKSASGSPKGPGAQPDKANLDYARKTTEMVLEKLKDQKNRADEKLLKDLDWTEEELTEFVKRWQTMRDKANSGSSKDVRQFEQALQSLGLKDPSLLRETQELENDAKTGYRQKAGTRKVPTEFAKKFRAIQKSQRKTKSRDD